MLGFIWRMIVFVCSVANAIDLFTQWHNGTPADWTVWWVAIIFMVALAISVLPYKR